MLTTSFSIIMHLIFDENKIFVFKYLIDFYLILIFLNMVLRTLKVYI
jgi:hypothetical protein